jgi:hypothetical protein
VHPQLRLIYANDSPADVLLKQQLDAMAAGYYGKFKARAAACFPAEQCCRLRGQPNHHQQGSEILHAGPCGTCMCGTDA